jgi:hypothetical protein
MRTQGNQNQLLPDVREKVGGGRMNRQEAIDRLKNEVKRIEEIMKNGDCGCVDMDTWNEFAKKAEWRETLIELLERNTDEEADNG